MDEAFVPLHDLIVAMAATADLRSDEHGVHLYVERLAVESPVELDVTVARAGTVELGGVPPLYRVDTSVLPSFHTMRFVVELSGGTADG